MWCGAGSDDCRFAPSGNGCPAVGCKPCSRSFRKSSCIVRQVSVPEFDRSSKNLTISFVAKASSPFAIILRCIVAISARPVGYNQTSLQHQIGRSDVPTTVTAKQQVTIDLCRRSATREVDISLRTFRTFSRPEVEQPFATLRSWASNYQKLAKSRFAGSQQAGCRLPSQAT